MTIGNSSGAIPEQEAQPMTEPREWPNNMKEYRDQSAERAAKARKQLKRLLAHPDPEVVQIAAQVSDELADVLRWLELAGAQTRPERL